MHVTIKTPEEQEKMRIAGRLAAEVLDMIGEHVVPGVTTEELDQLCHDYIVEVQRSIPANLNYRGFPKTICTSVNHVVCHGIPNDKRLKAGDFVNIDVTVIRDGFHGDTSRMYFVGKPPVAGAAAGRDLLRGHVAGRSRLVRPGAHLGDIGHAIQSFVEERGLLGGARVLRARHRPRSITRTRRSCTTASRAPGWSCEAGMTFTIEPMVNAGKRHVRCCPTAGRWSPRTTRCRRSGSTRCWSPPTGHEVLTLGAARAGSTDDCMAHRATPRSTTLQ